MTEFNIDNIKLIDSDVSLGQLLRTANGVQINKEYTKSVDTNNKYIGWDQQTEWNPLLRKLFTKETMNVVRTKVCQYLTGVDKKGRKIIPSDTMIENALFGAYENFLPQIGDIYGRFLVVDEKIQSFYGTIVDRTISFLVRGISTDIGMENANYDLNIWDSVLLGDDNPRGLRQYAPIKLRERHPDYMQFHMRY